MESEDVWGLWFCEIPVFSFNPYNAQWLFTENTHCWRANLWKYVFLWLSHCALKSSVDFQKKCALNLWVTVTLESFKSDFVLVLQPWVLLVSFFLPSISSESQCWMPTIPTPATIFFPMRHSLWGHLWAAISIWRGWGVGEWQQYRLLIKTRWLITQGLAS